MAEPSKSWLPGEFPVRADDINNNFIEALNDYRDFVYGENIAVNDALYLKASDGKVYKTDADYPDERIQNFVGFAKESGTNGQTKKVQIAGKVSGFDGLTTGSLYYLSGVAGKISETPGIYKRIVGRALSSTALLIEKLEEENLQPFIYGENISANDALYLKASDGKVYKTSASHNDERIHNFVGFAKESGSNGQIRKVQINGIVRGFSGLTTGVEYFLSDTAGAISITPGTYIKKIGIAISTIGLLINVTRKARTLMLIGSLNCQQNMNFIVDAGFFSQDSAIHPMNEEQAQIKLPFDGVIKNFTAFARQNTTGASTIVTVRKNGADTILSLYFSGNNEWKTDPDSVPVSASDLISVRFTSGGSGQLAGPFTYKFILTYEIYGV